MNKTWLDVVKEFNTTPFLFVGSGISRRYMGLPDWESLLKHFSNRISDDPFKFIGMKMKAEDDLAVVGGNLQEQFDTRWISDPTFRTDEEWIKDKVRGYCSPFKAEVAWYLKNVGTPQNEYLQEIETLKELCQDHISGFITTNYDDFLESLSPRTFKTYIGQDELIFSNPQQIAEIFKIHGSVDKPETILITDEDYKKFDKKSAYLAAKLMTIFLEYPIIFIGYRLNDRNVQKILSSIVECLDEDKLEDLSRRLIFVERNKKLTSEIVVSTLSKNVGSKSILMTKVETDDFQQLFNGLKLKEAGCPVRLLRLFKEKIYNYCLSTKPSKNLIVNAYDPKISESKLIFGIGVQQLPQRAGLVGVSPEEWYKAILFDDLLPFTADQLLTYSYPRLKSSGSLGLPVFKFLKEAKEEHCNIKEAETIKEFDDLLSKTIIEERNKGNYPKTIEEVKKSQRFAGDNFYHGLSHLTEENLDVDALKQILIDEFKSNPNVLGKKSPSFVKTSFRRMIRIYDWLAYGRKSPKDKPSGNCGEKRGG